MDSPFIDCFSTDPPTSADEVYAAYYDDGPPKNPQTAQEFGFDRLVSPKDQLKLLGLYHELETSGISSRELHQWQTEGSLIKNITGVCERHLKKQRGYYYSWFLEKKHLFDPSKTADEVKKRDFFERVIGYLDPEDQVKNPYMLDPVSKSECIIFYATMSYGTLLPPQNALWVHFGFCICDDMDEESHLADLYRALIFGQTYYKSNTTPSSDPVPNDQTCTFQEFHAAYETNSLAQLFRAKNISTAHSTALIPQLERFYANPNPIWLLKAFLAIDDEESVESPSLLEIGAAYGFSASQTPADRKDLKALYRKLLRVVDPLVVHMARRGGWLYDLASSRMDVEPRFRALMELPL